MAEFVISTLNVGELDKRKLIKINVDRFITESNIKLGISRDQLFKIKGNNYTTEKTNSKEIIKYRITEENTSGFLLRYNYPSYYAFYEFMDGTLKKMSFGFEYP